MTAPPRARGVRPPYGPPHATGVRPPYGVSGPDSALARETTPRPRGTYGVKGSDPPYVPADLLYGRLLATAAQHALGGGPPARARVRSIDGTLEPLPLDRWLGDLDAADAAAVALAEAPVLDLGCGPGRHLAALRAAGKRGLGVDLSPAAVRLARRRGAAAIPGDVFGSVPGAGRYRTALLLDGNIGIGGSPALLLRRTRELLAPGGEALVELEPPGRPTFRTRIRLEAPGVVSEWFAWARVGVDGIAPLAARAGLTHAGTVAVGGRWIAVLRRP
jgi:SAM-dependent methyltransferase